MAVCNREKNEAPEHAPDATRRPEGLAPRHPRPALPPPTCAVMALTPASSLRATAAAMRGVVVYRRKFQMKLHQCKGGDGECLSGARNARSLLSWLRALSPRCRRGCSQRLHAPLSTAWPQHPLLAPSTQQTPSPGPPPLSHLEKLKTMVVRPTAASEVVPSLLPMIAVDTMPIIGSSSTLQRAGGRQAVRGSTGRGGSTGSRRMRCCCRR